jgi:beta-glucanase (GH16 family)
VSTFARRLQQAADGTTTPSPNPDPVGQPAGQWTLKFQDEFNASSVTILDAANGLVSFGSGPTWKAWYPNDAVGDGDQHSNNPGTELEYYATSALSVSNSVVSFNATHDNAHSGYSYTSGMLQSNPSFNAQYGYAESRIKSPGVSGSWPAFWMIASAYEWPPEVDIYENFGDTGSYKASNFGSGATVMGDQIDTTVTNWHVYGLKWTSTHLYWYLDGSLVDTETNSASVPQELMYLVVNLAVRNTDTNTFSLETDYVRFWQ